MKNGWLPMRLAPHMPNYVGTLVTPRREVLLWMKSEIKTTERNPRGVYPQWPELGHLYWTPGSDQTKCYAVPNQSRGYKAVAWRPIKGPR